MPLVHRHLLDACQSVNELKSLGQLLSSLPRYESNALGGRTGRKIAPINRYHTKPLLKINKASLITRHLNRLHAADFFDIVINVSHLGEKIIRHVGDGPRYSSEKQPLEAAAAFAWHWSVKCWTNTKLLP